MKTIYATEMQWQGRDLRIGLECAAGGTGRIAGPCLHRSGPPAGEDKVIDLAAWKAENLAALDGEEVLDQPESGLAQYEGRELVRRPRRRRETVRNIAELAATLSVVGMMAALILRLLLF